MTRKALFLDVQRSKRLSYAHNMTLWYFVSRRPFPVGCLFLPGLAWLSWSLLSGASFPLWLPICVTMTLLEQLCQLIYVCEAFAWARCFRKLALAMAYEEAKKTCGHCGNFRSEDQHFKRCPWCLSAWWCSAPCVAANLEEHLLNCAAFAKDPKWVAADAKGACDDAKKLFRSKCASCARPPTGMERFLKCGGCRLVYYCSHTCQKRDWKWHKAACQATPEINVRNGKLDYVLHGAAANCHSSVHFLYRIDILKSPQLLVVWWLSWCNPFTLLVLAPLLKRVPFIKSWIEAQSAKVDYDIAKLSREIAFRSLGTGGIALVLFCWCHGRWPIGQEFDRVLQDTMGVWLMDRVLDICLVRACDRLLGSEEEHAHSD